MPQCQTCFTQCPSYGELARHIIDRKHKKGKLWANKYLTINSLSPENRRDQKERVPMTADELAAHRENKQDCKRELSGETKLVTIFCPKCRHTQHQPIAVEYLDSPEAWKHQGNPVVLCSVCQMIKRA